MVEDLRELCRCVFVDDGVGASYGTPVHAHIERCILHIGEAALRRIDLRRGDAEIKENAVHLGYTLMREDVPQMTEVIVHKRDLTGCVRKTLTRCRNRQLVLIDADQVSLRGKFCRDPSRMPCASERTVHIDAIRTDAERLDRFLGQNAHVVKVTHIVIP